jgi:hypothetical protein
MSDGQGARHSSVYMLHARLGDEERVTLLTADDREVPAPIVPLLVHREAHPWEVADADACLSAIRLVMGWARTDPVWARGEVTLTHLKTGRIVRTLPAEETS